MKSKPQNRKSEIPPAPLFPCAGRDFPAVCDPLSRRAMLSRAASGFGGLALASLLRPQHASAAGLAGEGLGVQGAVASPVAGAKGNREFLLWLRSGPADVTDDWLVEVTERD